MLKKYSFVVVSIAFLCAYKACAMNEMPSHLDEFPEERRRGWVTRLIEPLESLIAEIEKNKSALSSINDTLATGLNTDYLFGDYQKETQTWGTYKKGPFVIKPVSCEAEFLNPLLSSFKKILDHGKNFISSQTVISEKDSLELEDYYWPFVYADALRNYQDPLSQDIESWKNGEGKILTTSIHTAFTLSDDLTILMSHYPELNSFLKNFGSKNRANINIITIGCANKAEQQVYPWVVNFAKQNPTLKVAIDLFDKWENGRPEFFDEYQFNWIKEQPNQYSFENIQVNINTYIPLIDDAPHGSGYFSNDFHNTLANLIRKQLENNVVIISEHTGGHTLDTAFVSLYNQINSENNDLKQRLFLATHQGFLATHQGGLSSTKAFLYHQAPCNAKINPDDDFEALREENNLDKSSNSPEQEVNNTAMKEDNLETKVREDELEKRLGQIKLFAPKVYQINEGRGSQGLQEPALREQFLKEHADFARVYKLWMENQKDPDLTEAYLQGKANFEGSQLTTLEDVWVKHLF